MFSRRKQIISNLISRSKKLGYSPYKLKPIGNIDWQGGSWLSWLGGLVVAEGNFGDDKNYLKFQIQMTDLDVIQKVAEIIKYKNKTYEYQPPNTKKRYKT